MREPSFAATFERILTIFFVAIRSVRAQIGRAGCAAFSRLRIFKKTNTTRL